MRRHSLCAVLKLTFRPHCLTEVPTRPTETEALPSVPVHPEVAHQRAVARASAEILHLGFINKIQPALVMGAALDEKSPGGLGVPVACQSFLDEGP